MEYVLNFLCNLRAMHANNIDQVTKRWEYAGSDAFTEVRVVVELISSPVCMMLV